MKSSPYSIIPIHERPDLFEECLRVLNAEWPAGQTKRMQSFRESRDEFPTSLVLLKGEKVIGHCKLSLILSEYRSCYLGSVVIDYAWRSQGLGSMLLRAAEEYAVSRNIEKIYLRTKGQEAFYEKNGYVVCPPVNIQNDVIIPPIIASPKSKSKSCEKKQFCGPPPPPMPIPYRSIINLCLTTKTFMMKHL